MAAWHHGAICLDLHLDDWHHARLGPHDIGVRVDRSTAVDANRDSVHVPAEILDTVNKIQIVRDQNLGRNTDRYFFNFGNVAEVFETLL